MILIIFQVAIVERKIMELFDFNKEHKEHKDYKGIIEQEVEKKIEQDMFKFLSEIKRKLFKMDNAIEGETYIIDEIGDDEKYVFLTRKSDNKEFQEFNVSDELYNKILNDSSIIELIFENGEYKIKG